MKGDTIVKPVTPTAAEIPSALAISIMAARKFSPCWYANDTGSDA